MSEKHTLESFCCRRNLDWRQRVVAERDRLIENLDWRRVVRYLLYASGSQPGVGVELILSTFCATHFECAT